MAALPTCLKCDQALVHGPCGPSRWTCDHPLHTGPGRTDADTDGGDTTVCLAETRWSCPQRLRCNIDVCETCNSALVAMQRTVSKADYSCFVRTCSSTYRFLARNPTGRVLLYVDDEVDQPKPELQRIWAACDAVGVHVAKIMSTSSAMSFLTCFADLCRRTMASFRVLSDMARREPATPGGTLNPRAGVLLRFQLMRLHDFVGHMLIFSPRWREASGALRQMPLVSTTGNLARVVEFASFKSGLNFDDDVARIGPETLLEGPGRALVTLTDMADGVQRAVISRPEPHDQSLQADLFRHVESTFYAFVGSVKGSSCYLVESVSVFFNQRTMQRFREGITSLFQDLSEPHVGGPDDGKFDKFFAHLHEARAVTPMSPTSAAVKPVLMWHAAKAASLHNIVVQGAGA
eukprot:m.258231 g.258231  ORF g.258231 m.258231 type:complete len:405 (+) comp21388_c0_seq1:134-1348(+)